LVQYSFCANLLRSELCWKITVEYHCTKFNWLKFSYNASVQISKGEQVSVSLESKDDSSLYNIHTDDVSLKNQSQVDWLCVPWNTGLYCPNWDVEWGGGSDSHASQFLLVNGYVYMYGKICLEDDGGHYQVNFIFDTEHYVKNIFGSTVFSEDNGPSSTYLINEGTCKIFDEQYNTIAGSTAHAETHLDTTVTVTG